MRRQLSFATVIAACLLAATPVYAQGGAYASYEANLRAGPGGGFPLIGRLPAGTRLAVAGCTNNERWCDVSGGGFRGWVLGNHIETGPGEPPAVTFDEQSYWATHYPTRDFYQKEYGIGSYMDDDAPRIWQSGRYYGRDGGWRD